MIVVKKSKIYPKTEKDMLMFVLFFCICIFHQIFLPAFYCLASLMKHCAIYSSIRSPCHHDKLKPYDSVINE